MRLKISSMSYSMQHAWRYITMHPFHWKEIHLKNHVIYIFSRKEELCAVPCAFGWCLTRLEKGFLRSRVKNLKLYLVHEGSLCLILEPLPGNNIITHLPCQFNSSIMLANIQRCFEFSSKSYAPWIIDILIFCKRPMKHLDKSIDLSHSF